MTAVRPAELAGHQFFHGMPDDQLDFLAEQSTVVTVPARARFFEVGGLARHFWLIRAGQVALTFPAPGDGLVVVETLGRGEMVGVSWFFPPYLWQFGAVAVQPTEAFQVDAAAVRARCESDPGFGYQFTSRMIVVVARRLQAARRRMIELCTGRNERLR